MATDASLRWQVQQTIARADYRIFTTHTVIAKHPQTGLPKEFSTIQCGDWVNVIALTPAHQVVTLRQYRVGTDQVCLEIPGGMIDPGETPATAAARELLEETGYGGGSLSQLGTCTPNPAVFGNRLHMFLMTDVQKLAEPTPEAGEVLAVELQPLPRVLQSIMDGRLHHALVLAAFAQLGLRHPQLWAIGA